MFARGADLQEAGRGRPALEGNPVLEDLKKKAKAEASEHVHAAVVA